MHEEEMKKEVRKIQEGTKKEQKETKKKRRMNEEGDKKD